jgi:putative membrane protein
MSTPILDRVQIALGVLQNRHRRLTMIGAPVVLLGVPLILIGGLTWALHDPASFVDQVPAAVVNDDEPVTIDGRLLPVGRELSARLVDAQDPAYHWTLTNAQDAADGLDSGRYRIAVTIPRDFSRAATSLQQGPAAARPAVITVAAAKNAPLTDAAVGQRLLDQTRAALGQEITRTYLDNVYLGLNTMHAKLLTAADAARQIDDGAHRLAAGSSELATGTRTLDTGLRHLSDGAATLAAGTDRLAAGAQSLHTGATALAAGADRVATGNRQLADTVDPAATFIVTAIDRAPDLALAAQQLRQLAAHCTDSGGSAQFCARLTQAADLAASRAGQASTALHTVRARVVQLRTGVDQLAAGSAQVARGAHAVASGSGRLATGAGQAAAGATALSSGAHQAYAGSRRLATGADQLATGAATLAFGTTRLHNGLTAAVMQVPTYTQAERARLAEVVAAPITGTSHGFDLFTRQAMTLFAVIALWIAAMTTFALFPAVPAAVLRSHRPTWQLALIGAAEPALLTTIAAVCVGAIVALVVQAGPVRGPLICLAALATAATFQVLHRAVAAVIPRHWWPASITALLLTIATSITSAQPHQFQALTGFLPTTAGITMIRAAVDGSASSSLHAALALLAWLAAGLVVAIVRTENARTTSVRELATAARLRQPVRA